MINNSRKRITRRFSRLVKESNDILSKHRTRRSSLIKEAASFEEQYPGVTFGKNVKIDKSANIGEDTRIGPSVVIGKNVNIEEGVGISRDCRIADGANIREGSFLENNVWIEKDVIVEDGSFILEDTIVTSDVASYNGDESRSRKIKKTFDKFLPIKKRKSKFGSQFGIPIRNIYTFQVMFINDDSMAIEGSLIVDVDGEEFELGFLISGASTKWDEKGFAELLDDNEIFDFEEAKVVDFQLEDGPMMVPASIHDQTFGIWVDRMNAIYRNIR